MYIFIFIDTLKHGKIIEGNSCVRHLALQGPAWCPVRIVKRFHSSLWCSTKKLSPHSLLI